jgi:hypothetical protein
MDKWEKVAQYTWRLDVEGGYLYRVVDDAGASVVFVPTDDSPALLGLTEAVDGLRQLVEMATSEVGYRHNPSARAIRTCSIDGD